MEGFVNWPFMDALGLVEILRLVLGFWRKLVVGVIVVVAVVVVVVEEEEDDDDALEAFVVDDAG